MSRKKKIIISLSIIGLFLISLAISYAYFSAVIYNNEETSTIVGTAANLELTFSDGSSEISASDIIPGWSASKTFSVKNTGDKTAYYQIKISDITNTLTLPNSISYKIISNNEGYNTVDIFNLPSEDTVLGVPVEIRVNQTHNYTITTYYNNLDEDQSVDFGKTFKYTVTIVSTTKPYPNNWLESKNGTLLAGIRDNQTTNEKTYTAPGAAISNSDEGLRITEDDYGTSYYYRGNVENNYVVFANKCWRIVRVTGNGDIKLVLFNSNPNNLSDNEVCEEEGNDLAFARDENNSVYSICFSVGCYFRPNAYLGFMYGTPWSNTYDREHENKNDNNILIYLKKWYDQEFNDSQKDSLADIIWCNDKSLRSGTGAGGNDTTYGIYSRIVDNTRPTLKCPEASGNDKMLSKFTAQDTVNGNGMLKTQTGTDEETGDAIYNYYKVGLFTADELIFAGFRWHYYASTNNYVVKNANSYNFTLTPSTSSPRDWIIGISNNGSYINSIDASYKYRFRPSIALNYDTTISSGTGVSTDPFIVKE